MSATETMYRATSANEMRNVTHHKTREEAEQELKRWISGGTVEAVEVPMDAEITFGFGEIINVSVVRGNWCRGLDTGKVKIPKGVSPAIAITRHNLALSDAALIKLATAQFGDRKYTVRRKS